MFYKAFKTQLSWSTIRCSHRNGPGSLATLFLISEMSDKLQQDETLSASGWGRHAWWHASHKPFSLFSQFASETLVGFVHIKCVQFPKTSTEEGNTWIERDCLERETERKKNFILVTKMIFKMQITFTKKWNRKLLGACRHSLHVHGEKASEDPGSNLYSILCNPKQSLTHPWPQFLYLKKKDDVLGSLKLLKSKSILL